MKDAAGQTINQRIRMLRKELNLTQKKFAMILAVSQSQIASMETGEREVKSRIVKQLCDSFGVNIRWLRTGEGAMFIQKKDAQLTKLLALFVNLEPRYQDFILNAIDQFLAMQEDQEEPAVNGQQPVR
ncbi:MAG: helix-turn-helix domain-containing protein [Treponema sp.]|jgi:transcriptional regulator with XRE-family HTH domain|nr:helix-turn-helix domain-containing protein [Treponema sp.]